MSEMNTTKKGIEQNAIPLETAQKWARKWRINPEHTVKAHLIPNIDIEELMGEGNVDVRAYIGIDDIGEIKLMLVGVDDEGNDLICDEKKQFIYDFTKPCPNTCDTKSPLYTLE